MIDVFATFSGCLFITGIGPGECNALPRIKKCLNVIIVCYIDCYNQNIRNWVIITLYDFDYI